MIDRIFVGVRSPWAGLQFLFSGPRLFPYALVPVLFFTGACVSSIVWLTGAIGSSAGGIMSWLGSLLRELPIIGPLFAEDSILLSVFGFVSAAALFFVSSVLLVYACYVGTRLILVPFSGLMAEKTLIYLGKLPPEDLALKQRALRFLRSVLTGIIQVLVLSVLGLFLFALALIPGLQPIVAFVGLLIVAFDCSDYALECAEMNFRQKVGVFFNHLPEYAGFALMAGLTFAVPLLNLFFLPALVIGAAIMTASFKGIWKTEGQVRVG